MKKRWIKLAIIVLCVVLVLASFGFFSNRIGTGRVDRIELHTYDHEMFGQADLTWWEEQMVIALFNLSRHAGEVDAEPCCDAYRLEVYFTDGSEIHVSEGVHSKLIVRQSSLDPYFVENSMLLSYIFSLAEKYDLPIG